MDEKSNNDEAKTKNAIDKTKETITLSPSSSLESSFSNSQEKNYRENSHGVETRRAEFPSS